MFKPSTQKINREKAKQSIRECNSMLDTTKCNLLKLIEDIEKVSELTLTDKVVEYDNK